MVSGEEWLQALLDVGFVDLLPAIEAVEDFIDHLLSLVALAVQEEAVEDVLATHGVLDLSFLVVLAELGEVDNFLATAKISVAVDFEHYFLGVSGEGHGPGSRR